MSRVLSTLLEVLASWYIATDVLKDYYYILMSFFAILSRAAAVSCISEPLAWPSYGCWAWVPNREIVTRRWHDNGMSLVTSQRSVRRRFSTVSPKSFSNTLNWETMSKSSRHQHFLPLKGLLSILKTFNSVQSIKLAIGSFTNSNGTAKVACKPC